MRLSQDLSMSKTNVKPAKEYKSRQDAWQSIADQFANRDLQFSTTRGVLFLVFLLLVYLAAQESLSGFWLIGLGVVFVVIVVLHEVTVRRMKRAQ